MPNMKGILKAGWPFISAAANAGGPLGLMAAKAVGTVLGVNKVDPTPEGIAAAVAGATPEQLAKMQEADNNVKLQLEQMNLGSIEKLEALAEQDRESARNMAVQTHDWTPRILAAMVVITWGLVQFYLLRHSVPQDMRELVARVLGTLDSALMLVLSYYFGSSAARDRQPSK